MDGFAQPMQSDRSPDVSAGLPAELTRFIGREAELAEVSAALGQERLVTLMGAGGVGKTRLALSTARRVAEHCPDGVYFVELSELRDPELLANAVAAAVQLPEQSERSTRSLLETLIAYFGRKRLLIVLDTCEHLVDACAVFVQSVLRYCPQVRVLTTSRQPLDAPGESVLQVMPLPVIDPDEETLSGAEPSDAMLLFAERAAAVVRGFGLTDANREPVARLCHRLDGIPLAIELAAVRLRALSLEQLLARLDDRFRLLSGGSRSVLPRHQTLRTAIDWSHGLCSEQEQLLWIRLSVFAGEFELTAAEEVCAGPRLPADEILECLIGLVDKAIVLRLDDEGDGSDARYRMLDTIREYGRERLAESGAELEYRTRHRDHCLALAEEFDARWLTGDQVAWMRAAWHERASLRSALEFCRTEPGAAGTGLRLVSALWGMWLCTGRHDEGLYWLERLLAQCPGPHPDRATALRVAGHLSLMSGAHARGLELTQQARDAADEGGGRLDAAYVIFNQGLAHTLTGELDWALDQLKDARERFATLGERGGEAWMLGTMCGSYLCAGEYDKALATFDETQPILEPLGERWVQGWVGWIRGAALWGLGRHDEAAAVLRSAVAMCMEIDHAQGIAFSIDTFGWIAAAEGRFERAVPLLAAADRLWERFHDPRLGIPAMHQAHDEAVAAARTALGTRRYEKLYAAGAALPLQAAVDRAVSAPHAAATKERAGRTRGGWAMLTVREREIAALIAEGLSNRRIAERLTISKRTVDSHVEHVRGKLGYASRAQIATLATSHQSSSGTS
ncbi:LuxR family transcriptional regulator [Streptomyces sp. A7024]|uniref:LuxR family transcriptional regulator n=1 Tax=Streptomyces coryli TaxID=1128680 RepID=A0A6G4TVQ5_9ACTN|nr:LuxR C-terminal-related transcriptional regulator [Streptomyces coryli]NGN63974.1 LuxR family transcriptional regulator [Streptomyces coryli]